MCPERNICAPRVPFTDNADTDGFVGLMLARHFYCYFQESVLRLRCLCSSPLGWEQQDGGSGAMHMAPLLLRPHSHNFRNPLGHFSPLLLGASQAQAAPNTGSATTTTWLWARGSYSQGWGRCGLALHLGITAGAVVPSRCWQGWHGLGAGWGWGWPASLWGCNRGSPGIHNQDPQLQVAPHP